MVHRMYWMRMLCILACSGMWVCHALHFTPADWENTSVDVYGYTKLDAFWDSQQMVSLRDGHFLIAPEPTRGYAPSDTAGNGTSSFHFTAIESKFGIFAQNSDWLNMTAQGRLEADFFGSAEPNVATARIRHAYGEITDASRFSFLFGQTWHPLFIIHCYPHTLAFDLGAPAEFQARTAQIRANVHIDTFTCTLALASQQLPFLSDGPDGFDTKYIRQSATPEVTARCDWQHDHGVLGTAVSVKQLTPRRKTQENVATESSLNSAIGELYGSYQSDIFTVRAKAFYAQNATEEAVLGGYAGTHHDPDNDTISYTTIDAGGGWLDATAAVTNRCHIGALIAGVSQPEEDIRRSKDAFLSPDTARGPFGLLPRVESVVRASPRVAWEHENVTFGLDIPISRATYINHDATTHQFIRTPETGVRVLFVGYYHF